MTSIAVRADSVLGPGVSAVYTLRLATDVTATVINDTTLSCTMASGSQFCFSSPTPVPLVANDLIDVRVVISGGTAPSPYNAIVALVCQ
jgi:hypothetical protein